MSFEEELRILTLLKRLFDSCKGVREFSLGNSLDVYAWGDVSEAMQEHVAKQVDRIHTGLTVKFNPTFEPGPDWLKVHWN